MLAADANQGYTRDTAIAFARGVAGCDLYWLEEPCRWHNDRRAMRDVRMLADVRVCDGPSELSVGGCRDLMVEGDRLLQLRRVVVRRPDRVAAIALAFDVAMAHHEEPQISSHLLASIPHGTFPECFHPDRDPI